MTNQNLYLIGTVHIDLEGSRRLEGLLKNISPNIVALEFSKDREKSMKSNRTPKEEERETDKMLDEVGLKLTAKQRKTISEIGEISKSLIGFELRTCRDYVQENPKIRLEYIDVSLFNNGEQEFVNGYVTAMKRAIEQATQIPELKEAYLEMLSKGKNAYLQVLKQNSERIYKNAKIMGQLAESMRDPETLEMLKEQLPKNAVQALTQILNPERDEFMANRVNELYNNDSDKVAAVVGLAHVPGLKSRLLNLDPTIMTLADYDKN